MGFDSMGDGGEEGFVAASDVARDDREGFPDTAEDEEDFMNEGRVYLDDRLLEAFSIEEVETPGRQDPQYRDYEEDYEPTGYDASEPPWEEDENGFYSDDHPNWRELSEAQPPSEEFKDIPTEDFQDKELPWNKNRKRAPKMPRDISMDKKMPWNRDLEESRWDQDAQPPGPPAVNPKRHNLGKYDWLDHPDDEEFGYADTLDQDSQKELEEGRPTVTGSPREEKLDVDIEPVSSGWLGRPASETDENELKALAKLRSTNRAEYHSRLKTTREELYESKKREQKINNELLKHKKAVLKLKNMINESNSQNAILLYTNKVLNNASLNEQQKTKFVDAISKAKTINEAKTVYDTLEDLTGFTTKKKSPKSLDEAVNRTRSNISLLMNRRNGTAKPEVTKKQEAAVRRMQKLAGITKE
jgi:hypothetical protein